MHFGVDLFLFYLTPFMSLLGCARTFPRALCCDCNLVQACLFLLIVQGTSLIYSMPLNTEVLANLSVYPENCIKDTEWKYVACSHAWSHDPQCFRHSFAQSRTFFCLGAVSFTLSHCFVWQNSYKKSHDN